MRLEEHMIDCLKKRCQVNMQTEAKPTFKATFLQDQIGQVRAPEWTIPRPEIILRADLGRVEHQQRPLLIAVRARAQLILGPRLNLLPQGQRLPSADLVAAHLVAENAVAAGELALLLFGVFAGPVRVVVAHEVRPVLEELARENLLLLREVLLLGVQRLAEQERDFVSV